MKDQEVQTEITERENQHIEPGTLTKQCGEYRTEARCKQVNWLYYMMSDSVDSDTACTHWFIYS